MSATHDWIARLRALFEEVRRRRVFRAAVAYAAAALVVLEAASLVFPALFLPEWAFRFLVIAALLGFPVTVAAAWVWERTPEGVRRTPDRAPPGEAPASSLGRDSRAALAVVVTAVLAAAGGYLASGLGGQAGGAGSGAGTGSGSIAVLPFLDLSPAGDQEYFSDGVAEEILDLLAQRSDLRVVARTSSFRFKGREIDIRAVGDSLGAAVVLEGSVRKSDDRVRITAQLIDARSGHHLWSDSFDRTLSDVFAVQESIARSIVEALAPRLGAEAAGRTIRGPPARELEAYEHYLRGRHAWSRRDEVGIRRALEHFRRAVEADSGFARAYGAIAGARATMVTYGIGDPTDNLVAAREYARRALSLDEGLAEAHAALGLAEQSSWRWEAAGRSFRRALELNPSSVQAHHWHALYLACLGRTGAAVEEMRTALRLDPLSVPVNNALGLLLYYHRDFEAAAEQLARVREMEPGWSLVHSITSMAQAELGHRDEAVRAAARAEELTPEGYDGAGLSLAFVHARLGEEEAAREVLARLEPERLRGSDALFYGLVLGWLGDRDGAFAWLERARADRAWQLAFLKVGPRYDPLREDPRFDALVRRLGLDRAPAM